MTRPVNVSVPVPVPVRPRERRRRLLVAATAAAIGAILLAVLAACADDSAPARCGEIPNHGCPALGGVDICMDPSCPSGYACQSGSWVLVTTCPPRDGGPAEAGVPLHDSGTADVLVVDAPPGAYGGPGCLPLQPPECSLGMALSCGGRQNCCDCDDLFVCDDGGWDPWGTCVDGAAVRQ
jgi:hypothetical protein